MPVSVRFFLPKILSETFLSQPAKHHLDTAAPLNLPFQMKELPLSDQMTHTILATIAAASCLFPNTVLTPNFIIVLPQTLWG